MEPILSNPPFILPSETTQDKLIAALKESIAVTDALIIQLREDLVRTEHSNYKDKQFLAFLLSQRQEGVLVMPSVISSTASPNEDYGLYPTGGTQAQKIGYIVERPQKYGVTLFVTAYSIVSAIFQEEPRLLNMNKSVEENVGLKDKVEKMWRKKYGEAISRMASDGKLIKMRQIGTKEPLYYIAPEWFSYDQPKPKYATLLAGLERIPEKDKTGNSTDTDDF